MNLGTKLSPNCEETVKLTIDSKFKFNCHKDISCFNKCCCNTDLFLTPYDIIKLKNGLQIESHEFLFQYTDAINQEGINIPLIKLKMGDKQQCPFLGEQGCTVYEERPLICRNFPIGSGFIKMHEEGQELHFLLKMDYCKGTEEDKECTVKDWRQSQEVDLHDELIQGWSFIIAKKATDAPELQLDDRTTQYFIMASYDIDSFRKFVFDSPFLEMFEVDEDFQEVIKTDEVELMKLGHKWLYYLLFKPASPVRK